MKLTQSILLHALLLTAAALFLVPLLWVLCASVKTEADTAAYLLLPWDDLSRLTLTHYQSLLFNRPFGTWLLNSLMLSSAHAVIVVVLSSLGGFALAKYDFAGKKPLMVLMAATMMIPSQVLLPGSYELMHNIGWLDTYAAILVPGAVSVLGMLLYMQAMAAVPDELMSAARVDGCSELRLWWSVVLPCVRPMTGAFVLMSFLGAWNSYLWPQIVLQSEGLYTLPIGLSNMVSLPQYESGRGMLMAGTVLGVMPVMVLFLALQRELVAGLTTGAVKG